MMTVGGERSDRSTTARPNQSAQPTRGQYGWKFGIGGSPFRVSDMRDKSSLDRLTLISVLGLRKFATKSRKGTLRCSISPQ